MEIYAYFSQIILDYIKLCRFSKFYHGIYLLGVLGKEVTFLSDSILAIKTTRTIKRNKKIKLKHVCNVFRNATKKF